MDSYFDAYLKSINNPLPELRLEFENEARILQKYIRKRKFGPIIPSVKVLDVGCGAGRTLDVLASQNRTASFVGIDTNQEILEEARREIDLGCHSNVMLLPMDGRHMSFLDEEFDITYSTDNTIGGLSRNDRIALLTEQKRVTAWPGYILTFSWKQDDATTKFLKRYYPSIGLKIRDINNDRTVTDKHAFRRLGEKALTRLYEKAGIPVIESGELEVWSYAVGQKG